MKNWLKIVLEQDESSVSDDLINKINADLKDLVESDSYPIGKVEDVIKKHDKSLYLKKDGMDEVEDKASSKESYQVMKIVKDEDDSDTGLKATMLVKKSDGKFTVDASVE